MESIQKIMSDPESVKQLSQLAQSLGISDDVSQPTPTPQNPSPSGGNDDFMKLFQNISPPPNKNPQNQMDISKLVEFTRILETASKNDKNTDLILALKPHLRNETQQKADRLIKIFKLLSVYPLIKDSGILGGDFLAKP